MSTSYDTNAEHELDHADAKLAVEALRDTITGPLKDADRAALVRVAMALEAFAAGSTNIVPEE